MCFPGAAIVVAAAATALSKMVSDKLGIDKRNAANIENYNQSARAAERVNANALSQQRETDARNRAEQIRQGQAAVDKARAQILENRRAMGTARASAGTSGLMGLPLNIIEQNYQALIGGISTNLESFNEQIDQNYFFNSMDSKLRAQSITNQAIPNKPYLEKFGWGNVLDAGLQAVTGALNMGIGSMKHPDGGYQPQTNNYNPGDYNNVQKAPNGNNTVYSNL